MLDSKCHKQQMMKSSSYGVVECGKAKEVSESFLCF